MVYKFIYIYVYQYLLRIGQKVLYQKAGDRDQIVIVVKFVNGSIATLDLSRHSTYGYDQRMEIFTLKGKKLIVGVSDCGALYGCANDSFYNAYSGMLQSENKRKHSIVESTDAATSIAPILGGMEDGIGMLIPHSINS